MPKLDIIHNAVKNALLKDGWLITDDPYVIQYRRTVLYADLGAECPKTSTSNNCCGYRGRGDFAMDKLTEYPKLIQQILTKYVELSNCHPNPDIETFLIVDEAKSHYIWMNLGWQNEERITGMTVYVRIWDSKFWIEEDWTEEGIATALIREGVPKEDIVLAFHQPKMRQYTDFAVAS